MNNYMYDKWLETKDKPENKESLVLVRCGDFFESYCEDAQKLSNILGLSISFRQPEKNKSMHRMAGFPYHALKEYVDRLNKAGVTVVVVDDNEKVVKPERKEYFMLNYDIDCRATNLVVLLYKRNPDTTPTRYIRVYFVVTGNVLYVYHAETDELIFCATNFVLQVCD